jgi:hypothetical protein
MQAYAPSVFEHQESVLNAGVLLAIPALLSQGLNQFFNVFKPLPAGFYGLHHIVLTLCFMALCRIKNPEQLKKHSPGELGKLLGLDRIPEVGYFRTKLKQITDQSKVDELHAELFHSWVEEMPELFFYIDGHVRVYHGEQANLPKRFVSREKLCLSGTTEFWVNDQRGLPLMVVTGELNEKLKAAIEEITPRILEATTAAAKLGEPAFTIIFDREAYEPAWFKKLWDEYQVAVITYRKNVNDSWDEKLFNSTDVQLHNTSVTMQLCEMGAQLNELWFREIRKLSDSGHQASIMTTHPSLSMQDTASKMFSRWTQENFFKYMIKEFDFDRMIEYGTEAINPQSTIPNPEYRTLTYQIRKSREKKSRLEARIFQKMENNSKTDIENFAQTIAESSHLIEKINEYNDEIQKLIKGRKNQPARIAIAKMPEEQRYNKLKTESKKLKNAVIMVVYRAETALYNIMSEVYKSNQQEGRVILKEIFTSDADIIPDYENKKLTVRLHSLSTPRANMAVKALCTFLNLTEIRYPTTDLIMFYETLAV